VPGYVVSGSVFALVLSVCADELPQDVGVPWQLPSAEVEHRAVLAGEADRPDVLAAQLVQS